ncbi:hematopoietic cell signal transducer isoform X2 [Oryx dammah]|uniref:hematopoietic cell signal transducer isoform X2 n=1 Tax=Oryx dammah TaxID=59534 RepID=UPI001A9A7C1C|nr:hematopoietic cell signal transducer isoform X2 [Oryx dammah]
MVLPGNILFLLLLPVAAAQMTPVGAARGSAALSGSPRHHPHHQTEGPTMCQPPRPVFRGSCSGCGPLSLPLLAGLVAADAVVSLLIVVVVFVCARLRSRPTQDDKIYINMPGRG